MSQYDDDDVYGSSSQFLSPSSSSPRRSPSRQSVKPRRSTASLRGSSSLAHAMDDFAATNGQHSLAHELAVALMPEPSAGSKLLAEEFGIEYDEGAEGIDEKTHQQGAPQIVLGENPPSFADELSSGANHSSFHDTRHLDAEHPPLDYDPVFGSPSFARQKTPKRPEQDAMEVLAQDLESTDKFLSHLRSIDVDSGASGSQQPSLERIASEVIRRINESTRDRESQVRELLEYEREFRKIAGEVGGGDVLGQLDELTQMDDLVDAKPSLDASRTAESRTLDTLEEEPSHMRHMSQSQEWEVDPDLQHHNLEDEEDEEFGGPEASSPIKDSFPPPPTVIGPPTPATTIPQLAHIRSFTTSLISSLTTISEQAQVNGAATTEAGRKIRALKNKLGGWRTEWDSAERSRLKIEKWEAGIVDVDSGVDDATSARAVGAKRADGREIVQEHLQAFTRALADAALKTQTIMAVS